MGTLQLDPAHPPAPPPHRHAHSKPDTPPAANKISNNKLVNRPAAATFDEMSMERSKSFVKALQELKSLRPQLYSAADYCEKSYLHNEQKQMVLDNLKEYAVRALVNAVDHLGTVAYKLTDLFEQEATDVSNVESKISCLNQEFATCQTYMDIEGLRQQRLFATTPRHHKHYILPGGHNKKVRISPRVNVHVGENHVLSRPHPNSEGTPASKTLSWHLASETNSTTSETPDSLAMCDDSKATKTHPEPVSLRDAVDASKLMPLAAHLQSSDGGSQLTTGNKYGSKLQASMEDSKLLSTFQSLHDDPCRREACRPVSRNKSILSAFFAKNKYTKQKRAYVS